MYALEIRELNLISILLRVFLAIVAGGIIGLERGMKNRAAGFRTYILVCLGACVVMMTNQYVHQVFGTGDPVRMGAQVISGIGFLGAGTIIVTSRNQIKGLTTAAGLWACACVGLAAGVGFYEVALIGVICMIMVLTFMHKWEDYMRRNTKVLTVYVELNAGVRLSSFLKEARTNGLNLSNVQIDADATHEQDIVCFQATIKSEKWTPKDALMAALRSYESVQFLEEL